MRKLVRGWLVPVRVLRGVVTGLATECGLGEKEEAGVATEEAADRSKLPCRPVGGRVLLAPPAVPWPGEGGREEGHGRDGSAHGGREPVGAVEEGEMGSVPAWWVRLLVVERRRWALPGVAAGWWAARLPR